MRSITIFSLLISISSCSDYTDWNFRKFVANEGDALLQEIPLAEDSGLVLGVYEPWIRGVGFPYNGGLVRLNDEWLLAFRENISNPNTYYGFDPRMGIVRLDDAFRPKSAPDFVTQAPNSLEDPRLIILNGELVVVANAGDVNDVKQRNMTLLGIDKAQLGSGNLTPRYVSTLSTGKVEKNWSPFVFEGRLHFSSHLSPKHNVSVIEVLDNPGSLTRRTAAADGIAWSFGKIRGGTPAVKLDDEKGYLAVFHSTYRSKSGRVIYFVGAYTFEAKEPFRMTSISEQPILFRGLYESGRNDVGGSDWFVAFATGLEVIENRVFVSIGVNDATLKIVEMDLGKLLASMRSI